MNKSILSVALALLFNIAAAMTACGQTAAPQNIEPFSFIHISDSHLPSVGSVPDTLDDLRSYRTFQWIKSSLAQLPQAEKVQSPAFLIHTGDVAEYGFAEKTWELFQEYCKGIDFPVYITPGNHDYTWVPHTQIMRKVYGGTNYAFSYGGVRFISVCSATLQEPCPSFSREKIVFLENELSKLDKNTPVILFWHHPFTSCEFASRYDKDRVLDLLHDYRVLCVLDGHYHTFFYRDFEGLDWITGGSTFSESKQDEGYNLISLDKKKISVTYKSLKAGQQDKLLFTKNLCDFKNYPKVDIVTPRKDQVALSNDLEVFSRINLAEEKISKAQVVIDDELTQPLVKKGTAYQAKVDITDLVNGAHYLRVEYHGQDGKVWNRSMEFVKETPGGTQSRKGLWRTQLDGGVVGTPRIYGDRLFVGTLNGTVYEVDRSDGRVVWDYNVGSEILTTPVVCKGEIIVATSGGQLVSLNLKGKEQWRYDVGSSIHSSPVIDENSTIFFGTNNGELVAFSLKNHKESWKADLAFNSIESSPTLSGNYVLTASWDGYIYCLNKNDGKLIWKSKGPKCQDGANKYYAPADAKLIVSGAMVFAADRGYYLGKYDLNNGTYKGKLAQSTASLTKSENEASLYLRETKNRITKIDHDGKVLWECEIPAGRIPAEPVACDGLLYVISNTGCLSVLDQKTGEKQWQYQLTPKLFVMSCPIIDGKTVYAAGMDGCLTAISPPLNRE